MLDTILFYYAFFYLTGSCMQLYLTKLVKITWLITDFYFFTILLGGDKWILMWWVDALINKG